MVRKDCVKKCVKECSDDDDFDKIVCNDDVYCDDYYGEC